MLKSIFKKSIAFILSLVLVLTLLPQGTLNLSAKAETEYTEGYYTYTVIDGKATIIDCDFSISGDVTIPETLGGYPVTSIGNYAFAYCDSIESIIIGDSVTSIGDYAFCGCNNLSSINIPSSVTSIGDRAFESCISLKSITIPNSVTSIGYSTFESCFSLKSITIPNSVTSIGDYAFHSCESLENIIIGDSVTSIGDYAFEWCESLENIIIGDSVTSIGDHAFAYCYSLESITIPDSVTSIDDSAFAVCYSLKNATYLGTKFDWESVDVKDGNDRLLSVLVCQPKNVELSATLYTYNGKVKKPSVIVKTASGKTVSTKNYSYKLKTSGKYVGEHKITVTFKGDYYSGTKNLYFTIKPGATSVKKLTPYTKSIKVYLNKKTTQTSGYQIEWSTSKKFTNSKKALIKSNKTTSYTIKSLSRKKTYYVRVRTYKTVNGERIYSSYSSYKYTKTK